MKKILWASRHALDQAAEEELRRRWPEMEITSREITWPEGAREVQEALVSIRDEGFCVLAGVFPAQVQEILFLRGRDLLPFYCIAPVMIPNWEPDTAKVRPFVFARWAVFADEGGRSC